MNCQQQTSRQPPAYQNTISWTTVPTEKRLTRGGNGLVKITGSPAFGHSATQTCDSRVTCLGDTTGGLRLFNILILRPRRVRNYLIQITQHPMKRIICCIALLALTVINAPASTTLVESWENTVDGWSAVSPWASTGFSTTTGVTAGSYSWNVTASAANWAMNSAFYSASTVGLTTLLSGSSSLSFDVDVPSSSAFGYALYFDVAVYQPAGNLAGTTTGSTASFASLDGYGWTAATLGGESTLTWSMPASLATALAANPSAPTSIFIMTYNGGTGTMYLDNMTVVVPEPSTLAFLALGGLCGLLLRRRH